jgi:hypothetical protein
MTGSGGGPPLEAYVREYDRFMATNAWESDGVSSRRNHPQACEADLMAVEARWNVTLPASYRAFLSCNGGRPSPNTVDVPAHPESPTDLHEFFGLGCERSTSRIDWHLQLWSQRLETGLLPIARDSLGNAFCMSLRTSDFGRILYCDLQAVFAKYDVMPQLYGVAPDFESFLRSLRAE